MPWDRDPLFDLSGVLDDLDPTVEDVLRQGAEALAVTLADGSPVDSGDLASSWEVRQTGPLSFEVASTVPYADFVDLDRSGVPFVIEQTNTQIGDTVSALIEEA